MNLAQKLLTRVVVPTLFLVTALGCVGIMSVFSPTAENAEPEENPFPVEIIVVQPQTQRTQLSLSGVAEAERQVGLSVEVTGSVLSLSDGLRPGRKYRKGERILQIDSRDYEAALSAERARVRGAELELAIEENRQATAAREYALVGGSDNNALALRKPHLERARANLVAAQKAEERAALNVERATLRAPFNGVVVSESVEVGQWVGPGSSVVQLVGTDAVRVSASLPVDQLNRVVLPEKAKEGSKDPNAGEVSIRQEHSDGAVTVRSGWVTGIGGRLNAQTRTASLLITVPEPYGGEGIPLLPGAFVSVRVKGALTSNVYALPHQAIHKNQFVWVDQDGSLERKDVVVGWRTEAESFVTSGLSPDDRVVTTNMPLPIKGMKVSANE